MHYTPAGRHDVLDIVVHQNVRLSEVIATDVLDSDHLQIMSSIPDPVRTREVLDPVEKLDSLITDSRLLKTASFVSQSDKLLLAFASTVIPGFSLLKIHDQDFYSLLDMCEFRNGASSSMKEGVGLSM
jgi:hypothetical protein